MPSESKEGAGRVTVAEPYICAEVQSEFLKKKICFLNKTYFTTPPLNKLLIFFISNKLLIYSLFRIVFKVIFG